MTTEVRSDYLTLTRLYRSYGSRAPRK
jgi:hypothetical protein